MFGSICKIGPARGGLFKMKLFAALILALSFLAGCKATEVKPSGSAPAWVVRTPEMKGMICAVGASGPTYYREDAKLNAAENARAELARTISVTINTIMVDMATEKGHSMDDATVTEVSSWATTAAVENSSILEYWHDAEGRLSNKNFTYALGCMPRKFDRESLEEQLQEAQSSGKGNPKDISRAADEIIRQLEGADERIRK